MPGSDGAARYTMTAIVLHWAIALAVIGLIGWGWWMQTIPKLPVGPRVDAFNLHKSIGMTVLLLMLVRIGWRARHRPPPFMPMPRWQAQLAQAVHVLLYVCLIVQPLSGYLGSAFSGYPVRFFGIVLPAWAPKQDMLKDAFSVVHLVNSWVLVGALALHVAATVKHALLERDGSFRRMWPRTSRVAAGPVGGPAR
ncbi:MAG TPA: cytochrome b [Casimicrobiaceae bacterium]|nr:cytochrome b [Casimicrobiaceae bacterium]